MGALLSVSLIAASSPHGGPVVRAVVVGGKAVVAGVGALIGVVAVMALGTLLAPIAASARRVKPPPWFFEFSAHGSHTYKADTADTSSGCTNDISYDETAVSSATWPSVTLSGGGKTRVYKSEPVRFTGTVDYTQHVPSCDGSTPIDNDCSGSPTADSPAEMTITGIRPKGRLRGLPPNQFKVKIAPVGSVEADPMCPGVTDWQAVLRKTFTLTPPALPPHRYKKDLSNTSSINCGYSAGEDVTKCMSSIDWQGSVDVVRNG
jgi:hypothetical protein